MIALEPGRYRSLLPFLPDTPAATLPIHCLLRELGEALVDDAVTPRNFAVRLPADHPGELDRLFLYGVPGSADLRRLLASLEEPTEVACDEDLAGLLRSIHRDATPRSSHVYYHDRSVADLPDDDPEGLRRLRPSDLAELGQMLPSWAWAAFGGVREFLTAGTVFGRFEEDRLVAAAFLTDASMKYETLSAVTVADRRRRGHGRACCGRLIRTSMDRGRFPRVVVSDRNAAGRALAESLGFPGRIEVTTWFVDP